MKKRVQKIKDKEPQRRIRAVTPEEALDFLESIRKMHEEKDEPTQLISLRVPQNILRALKVKAKAENKKYQSLLIQYLREGLRR